MFRNFFIVAWRNLIRKKSFSFINIAGLSIGMATAMLILLWIRNEVSYDNFHANSNRLYEVWNRYNADGKTQCWNNTPYPMAAALQRDYPEIEKTARVSFLPPVLFSVGEKKLTARGRIVDSGFLQLFSFPLIKGDPDKVLSGVYSMVITKTLSARIFGREDPLGRVIRVDNRDNFTVTGVLEDLPANTKFEFEFLISSSYVRTTEGENDNWGMNSLATYVQLKPNATLAAIAPKIKSLRKKYDKDDPAMETFLYPLTRSHLHGWFVDGVESGGRIEIVRLFGIIAAFILLIACINFMNLSTARSEKRAKEVGIRKVVGAQKKSLIAQFLGESILFAFLAGVLACFLVQVFLPVFNDFAGKKLVLDFTSMDYWLSGIAFIVLTGILAGSYPAIYLSSFRPSRVLKGTLKAGNPLVTPRKIMVVLQFTVAIILIIATIVVRQQIKKAQDRQAGYSKDNLVYHFMEGNVEKNYTLIKNELLTTGVAVSVTKTSAPVTESWSNTWAIEWPGKRPDDKTVINRFCADDAVAKTMGLQMVEGRDLDLKNFPTDSSGALLNETAVKTMGLKKPLGQVIKDMGKDWHVVGVIKDFILNSPYRPMEPMFIAGAKGWFNVIHIKLNTKNTVAHNVTSLKTIFSKYNPDYELNYRFADEEYARKFDDEKRIGTLASSFALLTIVISCLGLFGLSSYMAENRIKEIGIRKVLGASVKTIALLLSKDFLKLVLVAFIVASPLAYLAMNKWLAGFPYRVSIQAWVFLAAGFGALTIALITVGFQAIKAGMANPVKSLRTE